MARGEDLMPPLGIGHIISCLKQRVSGVEIAFFRDADEVISWRPDVLGVSCDTIGIMFAREQVRHIREELPICIFLAGVHNSSMPLNLAPEYDFGVVGEGEMTMCELVELFKVTLKPDSSSLAKICGLNYREAGQVLLSPPRSNIEDLDILPPPDRDVLGTYEAPSWRMVHMLTSRGCPFQCAFCSSSALWSGLRYFSPQRVVNDMIALREKYDPVQIFIFDDLMVANKTRFRELCKLMKETRVHDGIMFRMQVRANLMTDELADLLWDLHFHEIDFGIESNSAPVLKWLNKRGVTPDVNQHAMDVMRSHNLSAGASLIIGTPHETQDDIQTNWDFVQRNLDVINRVGCGILMPLPATRVWDEALAGGIVSDDMDFSIYGWNFWPDDQRLEALSRYPLMAQNVSGEELWQWIKKFEGLRDSLIKDAEIRCWHRLFYDTRQAWRRERDELARLKGSRLIRMAQGLRDVLGHK